MSHQINIRYEKSSLGNAVLSRRLRRAINTALNEEKVHVDCEINVLVTDEEGIRLINRELRKLDQPTDVLSFPMFNLEAGRFPEDVSELVDPETGRLPLGDMVISIERAKAQAKEYAHSLRREIGYLTVHSILHLLGYDHMDEGEQKRAMRVREEKILSEIELTR